MSLKPTPPDDLLRSLQTSLSNLRQPWPGRWPGLQQVLEGCWTRLGLPVQGMAPRTAALRDWAFQVASAIEADGQGQFSRSCEPAYHNRLHIADTLVCMTHLLLALRDQDAPGSGDVHAQTLCLAVMTGHDFMHPGGSNAFPAQLERMAVQALEPLMASAGLDEDDRMTLTHCILMSDPLCVKSSHASARQKPFDLRDRTWMTVLVQEADILASTLPETQQSLTQSLSTEWQPTNPQAAAQLLQPQSRILFLEHAALFSSPAAERLGLARIKARQVAHLQQQMAAH